MNIESKLQKVEVHLVAIVAAALVAAVGLLLAEPFTAHDYGMSDASATSRHSARGSAAATPDVQPALLEPALRSLDGVAHHG